MDEYSNSVIEFSGTQDEYNSHVQYTEIKNEKPKTKQLKKLKKMVQLIGSSAIAVTVIATNLAPTGFNRFSLFGEAIQDSTMQIQLADCRRNNGGALVSDVPIPATDHVTVEFDYWMGQDPDRYQSITADGLAVGFLKEPFDISDNPEQYTVSQGGDLLYSGLFGAEVDIYNNGYDPSENHIAIIGDINEHYDFKIYEEEDLCDAVHHLKVDYNNGTMKVYLDQSLACEYDDLGVDESDEYYLMISSSTGAGWILTLMNNVTVNDQPLKIINPEHNRYTEEAMHINWKK